MLLSLKSQDYPRKKYKACEIAAFTPEKRTLFNKSLRNIKLRNNKLASFKNFAKIAGFTETAS